jgi:hypothetical protein
MGSLSDLFTGIGQVALGRVSIKVREIGLNALRPAHRIVIITLLRYLRDKTLDILFHVSVKNGQTLKNYSQHQLATHCTNTL